MKTYTMDEVDIIEKVIRNIAHEVRNPLTTIRGYAQLLTQKLDTASIQKSQKMIIEQAERIDGMFNDLYNAFTIKEDIIVGCLIPDILQKALDASAYHDYIIIDDCDSFHVPCYMNRLLLCFNTFVNGFNWKYFPDARLRIYVKKETFCTIYFQYTNVIFDASLENLFFYPFQTKHFFVKGTELFSIYCIANRSGWDMDFNYSNNTFAISIPL